MSESRLPSKFIENDVLRLEYLTTIGPRIIGLYVKDVEGNLFAETPEVHWSTPHGEFFIRGGHRLWTAPENPYFTCPDAGVDVIEGDNLVLRSLVDAAGVEKEITVQLDGNRVLLSHQVTWHGREPIILAPWGITQMRMGGMAILPLAHRDGLLPDRNLVLWPYSQVRDDRFELHDDFVLLHGRPQDFAFKIGNFNTHGWIAYSLGNALFVKRFAVDESGTYPDMGCNVEAYVKTVFIELESLGKLANLAPGESIVHEETWEVLVGDFPANIETARMIGGLMTGKA